MQEARIWEEQVIIPTYEAGAADKNPMFLEKRVYQGSSGKVYPYPTTEKISPVKTDKAYRAVFLENEYIKIMVLPELGGRIQRAYDKTNGYDFIYYNHVIKPALVGLVGPWISGGIEFNWPQHHRPTTFMPTDHVIDDDRPDGSVRLYVNDVDQMYGTKGIITYTVYPDKAYLEIGGQLYNRTSLPQTFLWWANPAVAVNDNTQSVFPPDVHSVYDHGKRDVSRFPIATGVYYKHDYSEGVDISRYKNIPVPTSYMAEKSAYDFVGGYDYGVEAGLLHVADHHVSPGKKQWTWGCGDFGKAWDRNLTDEDGPYIELMCGVYTDNQPDFTWLAPFEEKRFTQYFMPYKKIGYVKNATIDAMVNLETGDGKVTARVYATSRFEDAEVVITAAGEEILRDKVLLSPVDVYEKTVDCAASPCDIRVQVLHEGRVLVEYQPQDQGIPELAKPAEPSKDPEEIMTNEELFLTAQHIEQYRHATYLPDPYYLEGLKRDPGDIRINDAYGLLLLRRGCFAEAEKHFRKALERLTWKNPNPADSEAYYHLGLTLFYQRRFDEAYDAFFKATWSNAQQEMSFYYLACIAVRRGDLRMALMLCEKGLTKNTRNIKARGLKAMLLCALGDAHGVLEWTRQNLVVDPFDYVSAYVRYLATGDEDEFALMQEKMRGFHENYLAAARDFAEFGFYDAAIRMLELCPDRKPMILYSLGYYKKLAGDGEGAKAAFAMAEKADPLYCFPNKLEDIAVLEAAIAEGERPARANYYLGCLYYDKLQFEKAAALWEASEKLDDTFPTVKRNLSLAYFNKQGRPQDALEKLEAAFALDRSDARVFLELDQLYKKLRRTPQERLAVFEENKAIIVDRDDLLIEYITLLNSTGQYEKALETTLGHVFRPWEGAEGKITAQYKVSLRELAKAKLAASDAAAAKELLERALHAPESLGEGHLEGTKDNDLHYWLGIALEALGDAEGAQKEFILATVGDNEPAGMMYYYDQPADMILYQGLAWNKLGRPREANACFYKLIDYGERHLRDNVRIDYFAVSLPDFLIFEDDLNVRNEAHCYYLMGLGKTGLGQGARAIGEFDEVLARDPGHQNGILYRAMAAEQAGM